MAGVLGPVGHLGCFDELQFVATLRLDQWMVELPDAVADFCDEDKPLWFNDGVVQGAMATALTEWRNDTIPGGKWGATPIGTHPVRWQHRIGTIAQQEEWHLWCDAELEQALRSIGRRFAGWIRDDGRWEDNCDGGQALFGVESWASTFASLRMELLDTVWPTPSWWALHSPSYHSWM